MELKFEQLVIEPETEVPIDARVIDVSGYRVDTQGRILGKAHAVRDAVMWSIPVLWPIDLLMLPMRGPRPTLKEETRMTLKVMDDFAVPNATLPYTDPYGLRHRNQSYDDPPVQQQQPQQQAYQPPPQQYAPQPQYQQPQYQQPQYQPQYQQAPTYNIYQQPPVVMMQQPQVVVMQQPPTYVYSPPPPPPVYGYGYGPPVWGVRGAYFYRGW
jgi:hypothetical protein